MNLKPIRYAAAAVLFPFVWLVDTFGDIRPKASLRKAFQQIREGQ